MMKEQIVTFYNIIQSYPNPSCNLIYILQMLF